MDSTNWEYVYQYRAQCSTDAATNIYILMRTKNHAPDHPLSLTNLIRGVKMEKMGKDFRQDLNQKGNFY